MALGRTVEEGCAANRTKIVGYKFYFFLTGWTKHLSGKRMQNFATAQTLGRENNIADII
jgi:hypothetical protein